MNLSRTHISAIRSLPIILLFTFAFGLLGVLPAAAGDGRPHPGDNPTPYPGTESPDPNYHPYIPGEVIVKLNGDSVSVDSINAIYGTSVKQYFSQLNIYILSANVSVDVDTLVAELNATPGVVFAQPNYIVSPLQSVQGSVPFSDQDHIGSYPDQEAAQQLRLDIAHTYATGTGVKVGVIDGGVNFDHPELAGSAVSGWDFVDNDADAFDEPGGSNTGHGTFVAGVIHLVAPDAQIVAYRVADTSGQSDGDLVAEAILQAIQDGCKVINLSLVMTHEHEVLHDALAYARSQDVFVVTAAGNGATDIAAYPASDPNVLAVAAVDTLDRLADFSRYGLNIDVSAPGTRIYSPYDSIYAWWSGTSFAAPFAAGEAALKLSQAGGTLSWRDLHAFLTETADNIDAENPDYIGKLGAGLIDPVAALQDSVAVDTAWLDPSPIYATLAPDQVIQKCVTLGATNSNAVFVATLLGGGAGMTSMADSVFPANSTMCFDLSTAGLSNGMYVDTIMFDIGGVSNSPLLLPVVVAVNDTIGSTYDASVSPPQISVTAVAGSAAPPIIFCSYLTSTNAPAAYTATVPDSSTGVVQVTNPSGQTNDSVCVSIDPFLLAPGVYYDSVIYRVDGVNYSIAQPVILTVTGDSSTTTESAAVTPSTFYFSSQSSDTLMSGCAFLTSTNAPAAYTLSHVDASNWLHLVDSTGMTNDSVCFTVDHVYAFAAAIFVDTIFCHVAGAANTPYIVVQLDVGGDTTGGAVASVSPSYFDFITGPGAGGPIQGGVFTLTSSNAPAVYSIYEATGSSWLHVPDSAGTTNDSVAFTVDASGLAPGTYYDSLICYVQGAAYSPGVAISLTVLSDTTGSGETASISPTSLNFVINPLAMYPIAGQAFVLSSTNAPAAYSAHSILGSSWLQVVDSVGVTNDSVRVTVNWDGLSDGTYVDSVAFDVDGVTNTPVGVVTMTLISGGATASISPASLNFVVNPLAMYPIAGQAFVLSSTNAPAAYSAHSILGSSWLQVLDSIGVTNDSVRVTVNWDGLSDGTYVDSVAFDVDGATNTPVGVVTMTLVSGDTVLTDTAAAYPTSFQFMAPQGSDTAQMGTFALYSTNAPAFYSLQTAHGSSWLQLPVVLTVPSTNDSVPFWVDPTGLAAGTYVDTIFCHVDSTVNVPAVSVVLLVTNDTGGTGETASALPTSFTFTADSSDMSIRHGSFVISSTNAPANYLASVVGGSGWLHLADSVGVTNDSVHFTVDPAAPFSGGTYTDSIACYVDGVDNVPVVSVTLIVAQSDTGGTGGGASASAMPYYFSVVSDSTGGSGLDTLTFLLTSSNAPADYVVYPVFGSPWLQVPDSLGQTNDSVSFTVDASGLAPGTYYDSLVCDVQGVTYNPAVLVVLTVQSDTGGTGGGGETASVTPAYLSLGAPEGSTTPIDVCVAVSSSNAPADYVAWVGGYGGTFTTIPDSLGTTDDSLCLVVDPSGLSAGVYCDSVFIQVNGVDSAVGLTICLYIGGGADSTSTRIANYPNPFNPTTTIEYSVPTRQEVSIEIFNVLGRRVRTLVNEVKPAGTYRIEWNGTDQNGQPVASGVYLYRFQAGNFVQTKKMLLAK